MAKLTHAFLQISWEMRTHFDITIKYKVVCDETVAATYILRASVCKK
jgi:hypothetical protein